MKDLIAGFTESLNFGDVSELSSGRIKAEDGAFDVGSDNGFGNIVKEGFELGFFMSQASGGLVKVNDDVGEGLVVGGGDLWHGIRIPGGGGDVSSQWSVSEFTEY